MIQNTGLNRKTIDKYYTSPEIVTECINLMKKHLKLDRDNLYIEPECR